MRVNVHMSVAIKIADKKSLRELVPLDGLSDTHFDEIVKKAIIEELPPKKYLFRKGDRDQHTCYLLEGEVAIVDGKKDVIIRSGDPEARHPLAPQYPRQLSARTLTKSTVIRIDSGLLDVMLVWDQSNSYEVSDISSDDDEDWMTRLLQSEMLARLPAMNIQQVIMRLEEVEKKSGDVVVQQDSEGDYYYIIKQGNCVVARQLASGTKPVKLAELHTGDSFGEEALLSGGKRNASVIMQTDGTLMRLSKQNFDDLLKTHMVNQLDYERAQAVVDEGGQWLDVRLPGEYQNAHLEGSINIPLAAVRDESKNLLSDNKYVICCDTGRRSASAVFLLAQCGIDAYVLANGLKSVPQEALLADGDVEQEETQAVAEVISLQAQAANRSPVQRVEAGGEQQRETAKLVEEKQNKIDQLHKENEVFRQQAAKLQDEIARVKEQAEKHAAARELLLHQHQERESQQQVAEKKIAHLEDELEKFRRQDGLQAEKYQGLIKEMAELQEKSASVSSLLKESEGRVMQLTEELERDKKEIGAQEKKQLEALKVLQDELDQLGQESSSQVVALESDLEQYSQRAAEQQARMEQYQKEVEELDSERNILLKSVEEHEGSLVSLQGEVDKLRKEQEVAELLKETNGGLEEALKQSETAVQSLREDLQKMQKDYEELAGVREAKEELGKELAARDTSLQSLQQELDGLREEYNQLLALQETNAGLEQQLCERDDSLRTLQAELDELRQVHEENRALTESSVALEESVRAGEESLQSLQQELTALRRDNEQIADLKGTNAQLDDALAERNTQIDALQGELDQLQKTQQEMVSLQDAKAGLDVSLQEREEVIQSLRKELEELRKDAGMVSELEAANAGLDRELKERNALVESLQGDLEQLQKAQQELVSLRDANKEQDASLQKSEEAIRLLKEELDGFRNEHEELVMLRAQGAEQLRELEERNGTVETLQADLQRLRKGQEGYAELEAVNAGLGKSLEERESSLQSLQEELARLQKQYDELLPLQDSHQKLTETLAAREASMQSLQQELELLRGEHEEIGTLREANAGLGRTLEERESALIAIQEKLDKVSEEHAGVAQALQEKIAGLESDLAHQAESGENSGQALELLQQRRAELQGEYDALREKSEQAAGVHALELEKLQQSLQEQSSLREALEQQIEELRELESSVPAEQQKAVEDAVKEWELRYSELERRYEDESKKLAAEQEKLQADAREQDEKNRELLEKNQDLQKSIEENSRELVRRDEQIRQLQDSLEQSASATQSDSIATEELGKLQEELQQAREELGRVREETVDTERACADLVHENQKLKHAWEEGKKAAQKVVHLESELKKMKEGKNKRGVDNVQDEMLEEKFKLAMSKISALEERVTSGEDKTLRGEIEEMRSELKGQAYRTRPTEEDSASMREENDELRRELERLYKEQEIAIATGSVPRSVRPAQEVKGVDAGKQGFSAQKLAAEAASRTLGPAAKGAFEKDVFALADVDRSIFQQNAADQGGSRKKTAVLMMIVLLMGVAIGFASYWFMPGGRIETSPVTGGAATDATLARDAVRKPSVTDEQAGLQRKAGDDNRIKAPLQTRVNKPDSVVSKTPTTVVKPPQKNITAPVAAITAPVVKVRPASEPLKPLRVYRDYLQDKSAGPVMVEVPGGSFEMGSTASSVNFDERPQRQVSIERFSISKYEVSFDEYRVFAEATEREIPHDNIWGRGNRPVINVSWDDAVAYAAWLSEQTGRNYRLPSEAEWEYAARAGTTTLYWWGTGKTERQANCFDCGTEWDGISTAPVGSFPANTLGLHDMAGNALEWMQDCYHANYEGAPADGSAWDEPECENRVVRGGSYRSTYDSIRSSARQQFSTETRIDTGFRLVRQ